MPNIIATVVVTQAVEEVPLAPKKQRGHVGSSCGAKPSRFGRSRTVPNSANGQRRSSRPRTKRPELAHSASAGAPENRVPDRVPDPADLTPPYPTKPDETSLNTGEK
jgi:hypothetical protein